MSSYLDISLEKCIKGNWEHIVNLNQLDDRSLINTGLLKEVFRDTEHFDHYASLDELAKESIRNFAEKIYKDQKFFKNMDADNPKYPYKYKKQKSFLVELLWYDSPNFRENSVLETTDFIKAVSGQNIDSAAKVTIAFETLCKNFEYAHSDVGIDIVPCQWYLIKDFLKPSQKAYDSKDSWFDKINSETEFKDAVKEGYYENVCEDEDVYYLTFESPYEAAQIVKYSLAKHLEKQNANISTISNGSLVCFKYADEKGKEVLQYTLEHGTAISYPKDLELMLKDLEKELERIKESKTQNAIVSQALREATADLEEKDFDNNLGEIVKDLINNESEFTDYSFEYEEELKMQSEELSTLIKLVGENGRIVWIVS